ncbi:MAG: hypothetical protein QXH13_03760 [Thermoplasmata archaeon]
MIEHEVLVIGNTLSAHITAALLARKGINVGFVRREQKRFHEIGNLWLGSPTPLIELADVLSFSARLGRIKGLFVYRDHRSYRLPISFHQMLLYSYLPLPYRFKIAINLIKLNQLDPEKVEICTARDLLEALNYDSYTTSYLLSVGTFATGIPWSGIDAITFFASLFKLRKVYPEVYSIRPNIEQFMMDLTEIYDESDGIVYDAECTRISVENDKAIAAFLDEKSVEAKFFVLSTAPYEIAGLLKELEHPVLKEYAGLRTNCLDVKIVLKEKIFGAATPLLFEEAPLFGFSPSNEGFEAGGRATTYWRYFIGNDEKSKNVENVIRKFRVVMARAYPNFWSNVETIEHMVVDVPLPYYKKLPQTPLRNLFIGTRNVYGNNLRDEVRAGIDAFMLCHKHLRR